MPTRAGILVAAIGLAALGLAGPASAHAAQATPKETAPLRSNTINGPRTKAEFWRFAKAEGTAL